MKQPFAPVIPVKNQGLSIDLLKLGLSSFSLGLLKAEKHLVLTALDKLCSSL